MALPIMPKMIVTEASVVLLPAEHNPAAKDEAGWLRLVA